MHSIQDRVDLLSIRLLLALSLRLRAQRSEILEIFDVVLLAFGLVLLLSQAVDVRPEIDSKFIEGTHAPFLGIAMSAFFPAGSLVLALALGDDDDNRVSSTAFCVPRIIKSHRSRVAA